MTARLGPALALAVAVACGDGPQEPFRPPGEPTGIVSVTARLRPDVPTFKVPGRLQVRFERPPPPAGLAVEVGTFVLPPGARETTFDASLPLRPGRLVIVEETVSDAVPFLCGAAAGVDPRVDVAATVPLALCLPGSVP